MEEGQLQVNVDNILPIIKKWLYSDKDIFVRELISNACDAILKLKHLKNEAPKGRIDVNINATKKTITFIDNGVGLTLEETKRYISQIAFSGAEEFLDKYQNINEEDKIIGHFGIGFFSAYMVADLVEINSCSYKENEKSSYWKSDGSRSYFLKEGAYDKQGTEITLHISEDSSEYLNVDKLKAIIEKHCLFFSEPIYLNNTLINKDEPLWLKKSSDVTQEEYSSFYKKFFPFAKNLPLFHIHLNIDYPFSLKGILYFPALNEMHHDRSSFIHLYCNRVFVSSDCKDIFPDFLMMLQGVIDSGDFPLNVSRSSLRHDKNIKQLSLHIIKKIADKLVSLFTTNREEFTKLYSSLEIFMKLGALRDDKFYQRIKDLILWKTTSQENLSLKEFTERFGKTIYYIPEDLSHSMLLSLYKENGIEGVFGGASIIDKAFMALLEREEKVSFKRIDSGVHDSCLKEEKELLDSTGKSYSEKVRDFISTKLSSANLTIKIKSLSSSSIPGFLTIDEESRRMKEFLIHQGEEAKFPEHCLKTVFVINSNNKLIRSIYEMKDRNCDLAELLIKEVYDLACLSQGEMSTETLVEFVQRTGNILEKLTENQ